MIKSSNRVWKSYRRHKFLMEKTLITLCADAPLSLRRLFPSIPLAPLFLFFLFPFFHLFLRRNFICRANFHCCREKVLRRHRSIGRNYFQVTHPRGRINPSPRFVSSWLRRRSEIYLKLQEISDVDARSCHWLLRRGDRVEPRGS